MLDWAMARPSKPHRLSIKSPALESTVAVERLTARLLAILAADVAGFSALMSQDERATVASLDIARATFRRHILSMGGRVVDMAGDSVLAVFETASGAVDGAIAIQRELSKANEKVAPDRQLLFRIGVHVGDVFEKSDGSVYGDGINIAARLEGVADPGGVAVSQTAHALVVERRRAEFEDGGEHRLKNISRPIRVFHLRTATAAIEASVLRFGRFELDLSRQRLLRDGNTTSLDGPALALLAALATRAGELVSVGKLRELAGPKLMVKEDELKAHINALRKELGADVVATVPGRGYRFTATLDAHLAPSPAGVPTEQPRAGRFSSLQTLRVNLPAVLPPLIGRISDEAVLGKLIDEHRLVTLIGAGGMGKSSLARAVVHARRTTYAHGVCWVELAPVTDTASLPGAIAAALGVRIPLGEPIPGLVNALHSLDLLVGLDNAEHLLEEVCRVAEALLASVPGLRLLVTSQAPLRAASEHVMRIEALAVPVEPLSASKALTYGAIALFADRARAADARFILTDADAPAAIELCRTLDGHALAIELAAVRAPVLGVHRLAQMMSDRLRILTESRNRAAPSRQQTLRSALEWSYSLLEPHEQEVFQRLSVIAGSASLELVQRVASDPSPNAGRDDLDEWAVLDALGALVDRSLVAVLSTGDAGAPRYRLLESPRVFALEKLVEEGKEEESRYRHAIAMQSLLEAAEDAMDSGRLGVDTWQHAVEFDIDNGREALAWAQSAGHSEIALGIGSSLLRSLPPGMYSDRLTLANACEVLINEELPLRLLRRAWGAISLALNLGWTQRSRAAADKALALARQLDPQESDRYQLYRALCRCALKAATMDDVAVAEPLVAELRAIEDPSWPPVRRRLGAAAGAWAAIPVRHMAEALRLQRLNLELERAAGADGYNALIGIADTELLAGDVEAAIKSGMELVAMLEGARDEHRLAHASVNLAAAWLAAGDTSRARAMLTAAWPLGLRFAFHPWCAEYMALLAALERRPRTAARLAGSADARYDMAKEHRHANEALARERARTIVVRLLGQPEFERLKVEGRSLSDEDTAALAFSSDDG